MPDEELAERARLHGLRHLLHVRAPYIGCSVGLIGSVAALGVFIHLTSGWALLLWLIPALVVGLFATYLTRATLRTLARGGRARYAREIRRRCGLLSLGAHAADEKGVPGVTYSVLARCRGLPHGGIRFLRLRALADGPVSVEGLRVPAGLEWVDGEHPRDVVKRAQSHLTRTEETELMSLLADLAWGRADELKTTARDGVPCEMRVLDHVGKAEYSLRCNLAGLPDESEEHPGLRLLAFARARTLHHVDWAATSSNGSLPPDSRAAELPRGAGKLRAGRDTMP